MAKAAAARGRAAIVVPDLHWKQAGFWGIVDTCRCNALNAK
jgi:hypothetical protein